MADWYCFKDKVKMLDTKVTLKYLQLVQDVPGLKCPVCGTAYLTEYVSRTIVKSLEEAIEMK